MFVTYTLFILALSQSANDRATAGAHCKRSRSKIVPNSNGAKLLTIKIESVLIGLIVAHLLVECSPSLHPLVRLFPAPCVLATENTRFSNIFVSAVHFDVKLIGFVWNDNGQWAYIPYALLAPVGSFIIFIEQYRKLNERFAFLFRCKLNVSQAMAEWFSFYKNEQMTFIITYAVIACLIWFMNICMVQEPMHGYYEARACEHFK